MNKTDALNSRRTVRKFTDVPIDLEIINKIINVARLAPYPANIQPIKYKIITNNLDEIFRQTKWAGYLDDGAPKTGERPTAYIMTLGDKSIKNSASFDLEAGIAGTAICYGAEAMGIGACWLGAINREKLREILSVDEKFEILHLIALGYPNQSSVAVEMKDSVKYYMNNSILNVPKRSLLEVII